MGQGKDDIVVRLECFLFWADHFALVNGLFAPGRFIWMDGFQRKGEGWGGRT